MPIEPDPNSISLEIVDWNFNGTFWNLDEIRQSNWKIQDVKVVGSLHKPYGIYTYDPLIFLLSVCVSGYFYDVACNMRCFILSKVKRPTNI